LAGVCTRRKVCAQARIVRLRAAQCNDGGYRGFDLSQSDLGLGTGGAARKPDFDRVVGN